MTSKTHSAYGKDAPSTDLSAWIEVQLQEASPDGVAAATCIDIERQRHHKTALPWGRGDETRNVIAWHETEAWRFIWCEYLQHVINCGNGFHRKPVMLQRPGAHDPDLLYRVELRLRPLPRRKTRDRAKA
jgi:hypothetical protein